MHKLFTQLGFDVRVLRDLKAGAIRDVDVHLLNRINGERLLNRIIWERLLNSINRCVC